MGYAIGFLSLDGREVPPNDDHSIMIQNATHFSVISWTWSLDLSYGCTWTISKYWLTIFLKDGTLKKHPSKTTPLPKNQWPNFHVRKMFSTTKKSTSVLSTAPCVWRPQMETEPDLEATVDPKDGNEGDSLRRKSSGRCWGEGVGWGWWTTTTTTTSSSSSSCSFPTTVFIVSPYSLRRFFFRKRLGKRPSWNNVQTSPGRRADAAWRKITPSSPMLISCKLRWHLLYAPRISEMEPGDDSVANRNLQTSKGAPIFRWTMFVLGGKSPWFYSNRGLQSCVSLVRVDFFHGSVA